MPVVGRAERAVVSPRSLISCIGPRRRWTRSRIGRTRFLGREAGLMGTRDACFRLRWTARVGAVAAVVAVVLACLPATASAGRMGSPSVAALQVALRAKGLYSGTVDGFAGPRTRTAVRSLQRRAGISVDGVAGAQTLGVLGRRGRPRLGSRAIGPGSSGFDVAELQFLLAWHGFPSGSIDGGYGSHTQGANIPLSRRGRVGPGGAAGGGDDPHLPIPPRGSPPRPARPLFGGGAFGPLRPPPRRSPLRLARPISAGIGDGFGPRDNKFHPGLDFPAALGTAVFAARSGRVTWAGWWAGGYGNLVSVALGSGVRTMYAHLSSIAVRRGQRVVTGTLLGRVGSTGLSTGPHLHFELRLRGAAIDPLTGL